MILKQKIIKTKIMIKNKIKIEINKVNRINN